MGPDAFVQVLRRLEGLALAAVCIWLYRSIHEPWWLFALLFLAPDLAMLGYLAGPRVGAAAYNLVHTWVTPVLLFAIGWWATLRPCCRSPSFWARISALTQRWASD